jgi:hypothetical protein
MSPPAKPASDRYEPLPGLFGLPGFLLRKLSPRGRRIVLGLIGLLVAAGIAAFLVYGPVIRENNRDREAAAQRAARQAEAAELARLRREQRPRTGRVAAGGSAAVIAGVERAITRDARARAETGELRTPASTTECDTQRDGDRLLLACTAVTTKVEADKSTIGSLIGYPYRGAVDPSTGRYGICKTSGHPGEGSFTRQREVPLPPACGGEPGG